MQFTEKEIVLKDGRKAILRSPAENDAEKMIVFLVQSAQETDFLLCYPEERKMPVGIAEHMLKAVSHSACDMMISCLIDGQIVGNAQISIKHEIKTRHRATLALAVLRAFWGLGIGTALMTEMEKKAETLGIRQLELSYMEGNVRAQALYQKMGFTVCSEFPDAYRLKNGNMRKEYGMIKYLEKAENQSISLETIDKF